MVAATASTVQTAITSAPKGTQVNTTTIYDIARLHRDRVWNLQHDINPRHPGWEPDNDRPQGDVEWFWYLQGKAEAFAAIMSEIESSR